MGKRSETRITQRIADNATAGDRGDATIWDAQQTGLGLRVLATGRKTWVYRWRPARRQQACVVIGVYRDSALSEIVMSVAEARVKARAWRAEIDAGRDPRAASQSAGQTLAEVWPAYLEHKARREGLSPKTLEVYAKHWAAHLSHPRYGLASMPVAEITRRDVIRLQRAIADQGRVKAEARYEAAVAEAREAEYLDKLERRLSTAGNGIANKVVLTVGSVCSWLVASGELDRSPCERIAKLPTAGRDVEAILDREDATHAIALIREHAASDALRDILLTLILTIQRLGDIRDLDWSEVVLGDAELALPYLRIEHHKSRRRTRAAKVVPLGPEVVALLLARWPGSTLRPERTTAGLEVVAEDGERWPILPSVAWASRLPAASGPVYPSPADPGRPYQDVYHGWRAIAAKASRPRVRKSDVHGLRHAGASLLQAAGVSRDVIQQALHHSSPAITGRYLHATADVFAALGDLLRAK